MAIIVQKYGGTSVADKDRIFNVANRIVDEYKKGNKVVVTVSAMGKTTDHLIEKAMEVNEKPSKREMDVLLTTGEQISISILAMAIEKMGYPVVSLTGWQVGMITTTEHGNAKIKKIKKERLLAELDKNNIVIVAGFQGISRDNEITTLGRGGSDTTAVALAAAINADVCEIYTDVDGVYTADPRIVPNAKKLDEISYDEMLELASLGANVLHNRSVEMAKKYNIKMEVKSSFERISGTIVKEVEDVEKTSVRGVTRDNDVARISVIGVEDKPGKAFSIFSILSKNGISVDLIIQSIGRENTKDISFTCSRGNLEKALSLLEENKNYIKPTRIDYTDKVSKVSIVGAGMVNNAGVATRMFEALYDANINIHMIATSEIKVSVLIDEEFAETAVRHIHDMFDIAK